LNDRHSNGSGAQQTNTTHSSALSDPRVHPQPPKGECQRRTVLVSELRKIRRGPARSNAGVSMSVLHDVQQVARRIFPRRGLWSR
jgi:hypothetical protein